MRKGAGHRTQDTGHRTQDTGHRTQDTGHRTQVFLLIIFLVGCCIFLTKVYVHEKKQEVLINNLIQDNQQLRSSLTQLNNKVLKISDKVNGKVKYSPTGYNYLAIGNSITRHGKFSEWWNEVGMAASDANHDYFHIVEQYLIGQNKELCSYAVNYAVWEQQSHDRVETFDSIDPYLSPYINLITIQLSENIKDTTTFETDYNELIKHIRESCPKARIIIIGDFWDETKNSLKRKIAHSNNSDFVDLSQVYGDETYMCGKGVTVYGDDGVAHVVTHDGVAKHPGDKGMKFIADGVINAIKNNNIKTK